MANYPTQFYGDIEGNNPNNSEIRNFSYPFFGTMLEATNYLVRDGLLGYVSGNLYYKKSGSSSPVRLLDSNIDGMVLSGSVKDVSNFQISGSQMKFDVLYNSGSSKQLTLNISSLQTDTQISSGSSDPSLYNIKIFETNSNVTTIPLSSVISNYVTNNMQSTNRNLTVDGTKMVNRTTLNTLFNDFAYNNVLVVGRGLRRELIDDSPTIIFGEINPTTPNVEENVKIISRSLNDGWGTLTNYNQVGSYIIESYNSPDDLVKLLSGSRDDGQWDYSSSKLAIYPEENSVIMSNKQVDTTNQTILDSYIGATTGANVMFVQSNVSNINVSNIISQYSNETQISQPINCVGNLNQNTASASNLIHRGYVDTNFLNILGGTLLGVSGSGSIGYKAQNIKPSTPTSGFKLYANSANALSWIGANGFIRTIDGTSNTADRTYTLPNASGTIVLTTDLSIYAPILNPIFSGSVLISGSFNSSGSVISQGLTVGRGSGNISTNSAFGINSLLSNTSGGENTAIGNGSLRANTSGFWNTAVGSNALNSSTTTIYNVAVGTNSQLANLTGSHNTSLGYNSLVSNLSGSHNTAVGKTALSLNTGEFNTAVGSASGNGNNQGSKNTYIGYNTGGGITTGNSNTIIGANVSGLSSSLSNNIIIADGDGNKRIVSDSFGRIGIGTTSPDSSAILDLSSTSQGLLLPRMTTTQINAITTPSAGLMVYNSTLSCPCFYDGSIWRKVSHSAM